MFRGTSLETGNRQFRTPQKSRSSTSRRWQSFLSREVRLALRARFSLVVLLGMVVLNAFLLSALLRAPTPSVQTASSERGIEEELPQPTPSVPSAGAHHPSRWPILIAIPTVHRATSNDPLIYHTYLREVLASIASQLDTVSPGDVEVLILNNTPQEHPLFDQLEEEYATERRIRFVRNLDRFMDPHPNDPQIDNRRNPTDRPGHRVRQQTCDVSSLLLLASREHRFNSLLLVEDDFVLCHSALRLFRYIRAKVAKQQTSWRAVKTSFGLNGLLLPIANAGPLALYMRKHLRELPPDHLATRWMTAEARQNPYRYRLQRNFAFRYNLFHHIGHESSMRETTVETVGMTIPRCYEPYSNMLWSLDAYNETHCPYDDLWPCEDMLGASLDQPKAGFALNAKSASQHRVHPVVKHKHFLQVSASSQSDSGSNTELTHVHEQRTLSPLLSSDTQAYDALIAAYENTIHS